MPVYRIFHLRASDVERFRGAPPKSPPYQLKPQHYEEVGQIEAFSAYSAWQALQGGRAEGTMRNTGVGDVLQAEAEPPHLCTFWGFEPAAWQDVGHPAGESPELTVATPAAQAGEAGTAGALGN